MKKYSFSEFPEFQEKVKKEPKQKPQQVSEAAQDKRHEKINFKQYLRGLQESQGMDDEFADIPMLVESDLVSRFGNLWTIKFGDEPLHLSEEDLEGIKSLHKDESITIVDEYEDRWFVQRSLANQLVFESQDYDLSGKIFFDTFVKHLK